MKWLITGGCGFIGLNLTKALVREGGHDILIVDNLSVGKRENLARVCQYSEKKRDNAGSTINGVHLIVGDIVDGQMALDISADVDVIVHLAANAGVEPSVKDPRLDCVTNVIGTLNYLEAARHNGVKRFVFASSGAPIGECSPPINEELPAHPASPYGASKLAGEGYCSAYFRTFGIDTVILRFGNVYGPYSDNKSSVVAKFIRQAMAGRPLEIFGDGGQTRDFIYVDDLIRAIRQAVNASGVGGETFQIASNSETSVADLTKKIIPLLTAKGIENVTVQHALPRIGDVRRSFSDVTKARSILGWECNYPLDMGLKAVVDWFFQNKVRVN